MALRLCSCGRRRIAASKCGTASASLYNAASRDLGMKIVADKKYDETSLLNQRMFPDMFNFARQIQATTDHARNCCAALAGASSSPRRPKASVDGVTAAATGAIAGAAFVLGRRAIVDVPTVVIGLVTLLALVYARKIPEPLIILAAGVIGLILKTSV